MNMNMKIDAVFESGVFRPTGSVPLSNGQQVTLTVELPKRVQHWPEDVAAVYAELADEDRRLAQAAFHSVKETWPALEEKP